MSINLLLGRWVGPVDAHDTKCDPLRSAKIVHVEPQPWDEMQLLCVLGRLCCILGVAVVENQGGSVQRSSKIKVNVAKV